MKNYFRLEKKLVMGEILVQKNFYKKKLITISTFRKKKFECK